MEAVAVDAGAEGGGGGRGDAVARGRMVGWQENLGTDDYGVGRIGGGHEAYGVEKNLGEDQGHGVVGGIESPGVPKNPGVEGTPQGGEPFGVTPEGDRVTG